MDDTYTLISSVHRSIGQFIQTELKKEGVEGIVPSHGAILIELFGHDGSSMNELAARIGKTPSTVTALVRKLENHGYVRQGKSREDGRVTCVFLTEAGLRLKPVLARISGEIYERQYEGLGQEEIFALRKALKQIQRNFEAAADVKNLCPPSWPVSTDPSSSGRSVSRPL